MTTNQPSHLIRNLVFMRCSFLIRRVAIPIAVVLFLRVVPACAASSDAASESSASAPMRVVLDGGPAKTKAAVCRDLDTLLADPHSTLHDVTGRNATAAVESVSLYRLGQAAFQELVEIRYLVVKDAKPEVYSDLRLTLIGTREDGYCSVIAVEQTLTKSFLQGRERASSRLVTIGSQSFVESIVRIPGTGAFRHEHYFRIVDGSPVELNLAEQASTLAARFVPQGTGIWKGSSFDLMTLQWRSGLWRPLDANCCPSGGTLFIQFRLNEDHLEVMEHELFRDWESLVEKHGETVNRF